MKLVLNENVNKVVLSENLKYHLKNRITIQESVFRIGSDSWCDLINEVRELHEDGAIVLNEEEQEIIDSDAGEYGLYEGEDVPLDAPFPLDDKGNYGVFCLNENGETTKVVFSEGVNNSTTLYHGSDHEITSFTTEFVGAEKAIDQEGPGIYLTTDFEDATKYGKYVYKLKLAPGKFISDKTPASKANKNILARLIKFKEDWQMNAQDWDENPNRGLMVAIESAIDYNDSLKDVFLQIWHDFFRYRPKDYVNAMVKLGFGGLLINNAYGQGDFEGKHIILYDVSLISIEEVINI